jgi:hypothetical protein
VKLQEAAGQCYRPPSVLRFAGKGPGLPRFSTFLVGSSNALPSLTGDNDEDYGGNRHDRANVPVLDEGEAVLPKGAVCIP